MTVVRGSLLKTKYRTGVPNELRRHQLIRACLLAKIGEVNLLRAEQLLLEGVLNDAILQLLFEAGIEAAAEIGVDRELPEANFKFYIVFCTMLYTNT